jgi:AraC-like DNA-binding protein
MVSDAPSGFWKEWGMTGVETIARIRFEHFQNRKGIKRIARELGLARDTVRRVLRSEATEFNYKRAVQPQPKLGPWVEALTAILDVKLHRSGPPYFHPRGTPLRGGFSRAVA